MFGATRVCVCAFAIAHIAGVTINAPLAIAKLAGVFFKLQFGV
jgi:hypothetical protein